MKCFNCSAPITENEKFCGHCGANQGFDDILILRAAQGDQGALTELYNKTSNNVYYTVKALIKDEDAALDVMQDSYLKAFKNLDTLKEADKFLAWIKRIAHNNAVDYLRRAKPVMFSSMSSDDSEAEVEFEDTNSANLPEVVIDRQETTRLMTAILDSLPDDQRMVTTMYYYEGMSVKEIAAELGVSENTVKSRLNYARKKIEAQVLDLEKKGTKLYGLAPIPFLMLLFRNWSSAPAATPVSMAGSVASAAGKAAVTNTVPHTASPAVKSEFSYNSANGHSASMQYSKPAPQQYAQPAPQQYAQPAQQYTRITTTRYTQTVQQQYAQPAQPAPPTPPQPAPHAPNPAASAVKAAGKTAKHGVGFKILVTALSVLLLGGGAVGVMYFAHLGPFADGGIFSSQPKEPEYEGTPYTDPSGTWTVNLPDDWSDSIHIRELNPNEMGGADVYFEYKSSDGESYPILCIYTVGSAQAKYLGYFDSMLGEKLASTDSYTVYSYDCNGGRWLEKKTYSDKADQKKYDKLVSEIDQVKDTFRTNK